MQAPAPAPAPVNVIGFGDSILGYEVIDKNYSEAEIKAAHHRFGDGNDRHVPVETLLRGALMFHYFQLLNRDHGENDRDYSRRLMGYILSRSGIPIEWNRDTQRWEICFERNVKKNNYYYPNPCAGFGVAGWGKDFNAGLILIARRDSRWAYLKSGTRIPNDRAVHRLDPIANDALRNYDYLRIKQCDRIHGKSCRAGADYDVCLTHHFQQDHQIDGITAIAGEDDLMDFRVNQFHVYNPDVNKSMYRVMKRYFRIINQKINLQLVAPPQHLDPQTHQLLWKMNLLCLETDVKRDGPAARKLNVGFREFSCPGFGHGQINIPHSDLPHPFIRGPGDDSNYNVLGSHYDNVDNVVRRRFQVRHEVFTQFYETYIVPHLLFGLVNFVTPRGNVGLPGADVVDPGLVVPMPGGVVAPDELRYSMNGHIGSLLFNPGFRLRFDPNHNIFYRTIGLAPRIISLDMEANFASGFPFPAPFTPVSPQHDVNYDLYGSMRLVTDVELENIKILKELFTNKAWEIYWMCTLSLVLRSGNTTQFITGPFYNPLSLPITRFQDMISLYQDILTNLENVAGVVWHSNTWDILNGGDPLSTGYRIFLQNLLNFPVGPIYTIDAVNYPFLLAVCWVTLVPPASRIIQSGGGKNRNVENAHNAFASNNFRNTFKKNWNKFYNKTNKANKPNKTRKMSNIINLTEETTEENKESKESSSQMGGHTSENITNTTKDQEYILDYIQKDETLGKLWKLMFYNPEKTEPTHSTKPEASIFKNVVQTEPFDFSKYNPELNKINIKKYTKNTRSNNNRPLSSSKTRRRRR